MLKTGILITSVGILLGAVYYFMVYKPTQYDSSPVEGAACRTPGLNLPGTIKGGVCVINKIIPSGLPTGVTGKA